MSRGRPKGAGHDPEVIEKIRQSNVRRWQDPEFRARHLPRLAAMQAERRKNGNCGGRKRGSKQSPETIEKIRQSMIKRWQDPEFRARHLPRLSAMQKKAASLRFKPPPEGTPARKGYIKVRAILGIEVARGLQW